MEIKKISDFTSLTGLLGTTEPGDQGIRSTGETGYQHPPYDQTKKLRSEIQARIKNMSLDEIHQFVVKDMPAGLEAIATSQMPLSDIPKFYEIVNITIDSRTGRLIQQTPQVNTSTRDRIFKRTGEIVSEKLLDYDRLDVARCLAYSVAFNEGLFGSTNVYGYIPDQTVSLYRKEEIIVGNIERAARTLKEAPDIFGRKTRVIYDGIVSRLNRNRAMFGDRRVLNKDFPPFPQRKSAGQ